MSKKRNASLYVLEILKLRSNIDNVLKKRQIQEILKKEYGYELDVRTVSKALEDLLSLGYPLGYTLMENGTSKTDWYYKKALSENASLALSVALKSTPYVSDDVFKTVFALLDPSHKSLKNNVTFSEFANDRTAEIEMLTVLSDAIAKRKMIHYSLISYVLSGKRHFEQDCGSVCRYIAKPLKIVHNGIECYLFAELGDTGTYRFIKLRTIGDVEITDITFHTEDIPSPPMPQNQAEANAMLSTEREKAVIRVDKHLVGAVADAFGELCSIKALYGKYAEIEITSPLRVVKAFAMMLGTGIEVLSPTKLRRSIALELKETLSKYPDARRLRGSV